MEDGLEINRCVKVNTVLRVNYFRLFYLFFFFPFTVFPVFIGLMMMMSRRNSFINAYGSCSFLDISTMQLVFSHVNS